MIQNISAKGLRELRALHDIPEYGDPDDYNVDDVLRGDAPLDISHAGGEFAALLSARIMDGAAAEYRVEDVPEKQKSKRKDTRTRRDRTERRNMTWALQKDGMVKAYLAWSANQGDSTWGEVCAALYEGYEVDTTLQNVRIFDTYDLHVGDVEVFKLDPNIPATFIRQGLIPSAPARPKVAFTTRMLEIFRVLHLRCPSFSKHAFMKGICDVSKVPFTPTLGQQFTIAYDAYLDLREQARILVSRALGQDTPQYRLRNCCPACTYKLEDEPKLMYEMLFTMDGNDSLKRMLRRSKEEVWEEEENGDVHRGEYSTRQVSSWRYAGMDLSCLWLTWAKYPIAIVEALLNALGEGLVGGYDIGCKNKGTIRRSPLGELAEALGYTSVVGAFHGHAHNRLCQLKFLVSYLVGMGIEDFEGCERYFGKSNALAGSTRYATVFHRQQDIVAYMRHTDAFETSANLSVFLCHKYRLAITSMQTLPALKTWMRANGVDQFSTFNTWMKEEYEYLLLLAKEPLVKTLEMEYYQKLVLSKQWDHSSQRRHMENPAANNLYEEAKRVAAQESKRREALELRDKNLEVVLLLEVQLNIKDRWLPRDANWERAALMVSNRRYQRCIDDLEGKVVARLFELTNMNQSQTGYAMRKHMATALSTRSKAIQALLEKYNAAAAALDVPRPLLSWELVVEYVFLSDFDLLRDTNRMDPSERPWAEPTARLATDKYNKILRAREEIQRLNIEIRRVITHMRDEDIFLKQKVAETADNDPTISHQIAIYHEERTRFNDLHIKCFRALALEPGFTGTLIPGVRRQETSGGPSNASEEPDLMDVDMEAEDAVLSATEAARRGVHVPQDREEDWFTDVSDSDEESGAEEEEEGVASVAEQLLRISFDE
ncbi:hypothetical protein C8J57DRAFT_1529765 [Mycena rebaudengoi]|nr:hypothetical protein C8J57DRAFT_1529765 [Mycena rebaudengoi]